MRSPILLTLTAVGLCLGSCGSQEEEFCQVRTYHTAEKAVEDMQRLPNRSPAMEAMAYQNQLNDCVDLEAASLRRSHDPAELVTHVVVNECQGFTSAPRRDFTIREMGPDAAAGVPLMSYEVAAKAFDDDLYKAALTRVVSWRAKSCRKLEEI